MAGFFSLRSVTFWTITLRGRSVAVLRFVGCLAASLASTHQMPVASHLWQLKISPDIANLLYFEQVAHGKGDGHYPITTVIRVRFGEEQGGPIHFLNESVGEAVWQNIRNRFRIMSLYSPIKKKTNKLAASLYHTLRHEVIIFLMSKWRSQSGMIKKLLLILGWSK